MREKGKYSQWKFITTFVVVMGLFASVKYGFGIEVPVKVVERGLRAEARFANINEEVMEEEKVVEEEVVVLDDIENTEDEVLYEEEKEDSVVLPSVLSGAHRVRGVWSYSECFPDSQSVQIEAAQKYGITPVQNRMEAEVLVKEHRLVNICHSPFYAIDDLTHSIPYLVPRAQHLLNMICLNFIDSC